MKSQPTAIPEVTLITPERFGDLRGYLSEVYRHDRLRQLGIEVDFLQDNISLSADVGTVRGLHFQITPMAQAKIVFVLRGAILDVAVDLRAGSPTFGQHVSAMLSEDNGHQLYVPVGFAHGFATLAPNTLVYYKISSLYTPELERGILWNDPDLAIEWPVSTDRAIVSARDKQQPRVKDLETYFQYNIR